MAAIADALAELAADGDYLAPWLARLGPGPGAVAILAPARGPRLTLVRRPEGELSAVHDHGTWVAIATISGTETHRRYDRLGIDGIDGVTLVDERDLVATQTATLLPPDDVHDHGHVLGHGATAAILVLTGDDQTRFIRHEWDLATGQRRVLRPGDGGRFVASEPIPGA